MPFRRSLKPLVLALALLGAPAACGGEDDGAPPGGGSPPPPAAERTPEAQERPDENAGGASGDEGRPGETGGGSSAAGARGSSGGDDNAGGGRGGSYDPERPDSPDNDVPPPRGSPAERFERFCEKNPQECY